MEFTERVDICNEFNHCFCNVGENHKQLNFMNYCRPSIPHSMACESIDRDELLKLINTLNPIKSPGPDNIGS